MYNLLKCADPRSVIKLIITTKRMRVRGAFEPAEPTDAVCGSVLH